MKLNKLLQSVLAMAVAAAWPCVHANLFEAGNFLEDVSQPRYGTLPPLSLDRYMRAVFEPHNAMAHVTQNFMNFCMGTVFWVTAAAIYERVNPPEDLHHPFRYHDKEDYGMNYVVRTGTCLHCLRLEIS